MAAAVAFALMAGTAHAASVEVSSVIDCGGDPACEKYQAGSPHDTFVFTAAAGEANDVTLRVQGTSLLVHDAGAPLTAGRLCTVAGDHDATCDVSGTPRVAWSIGLGDGGDRVTVDGTLPEDVTIDGGAGDDQITGGGERDHLRGGAGSDRVAGGAGGDTIEEPDTVEPDALDGGPDFDLLTYADRRQGVRVDLRDASPSQGSPGEGDTIAGIENVRGGSGDDTLLGDESANGLSGGGGADDMDGRGGDDELAGEAGIDVFQGGAGNDAIDSNDRRAELVSCGTGRDLVAGERVTDLYGYDMAWVGADATDVVGGDCEGVALYGDPRVNPFRVDPRAHRRGAVVALRNPCHAGSPPRRCSGRLSAYVKGKDRPGTARFAHSGTRIRVSLGGRARRAAARGAPVTLRMVLRLRGNAYMTSFSARLANP